MSSAWTDLTLVDALLKGDEAAEVLFGEDYCAPILRMLSSRFRVELDDLRRNFKSQVHKNHWHCLRIWKGKCPLKYYLRAIAANLCRRSLRKPSLRPPTGLTDRDGRPLELRDEAQPDPPKVLLAKEKLATVLRSIEELPEKRDRLMLYMAMAGWSSSQIADQLGLLPGAASTALSRARDRLDEMLRKGGYDDD